MIFTVNLEIVFIINCVIIFSWIGLPTKIFCGNFSEKRSTKGLLRGYRIYPEPWEAAVGQELARE